MRKLPRIEIHSGVVLDVDYVAAALEHERLEALLTQLLGGPSPGNSGADHDRVVRRRLAHRANIRIGGCSLKRLTARLTSMVAFHPHRVELQCQINRAPRSSSAPLAHRSANSSAAFLPSPPRSWGQLPFAKR